MYLIIDTILILPHELHEITSDEPFNWVIYNCGPGRVLINDKILLAKGDITVVSGSGPITVLCDDDEKAFVMVHPGAF